MENGNYYSIIGYILGYIGVYIGDVIRILEKKMVTRIGFRV